MSTTPTTIAPIAKLEKTIFEAPWAKTRGVLLATIMLERELAAAEALVKAAASDPILKLLVDRPEALLRIVELQDDPEDHRQSEGGAEDADAAYDAANDGGGSGADGAAARGSGESCAYCSKLLKKALTCSKCHFTVCESSNE